MTNFIKTSTEKFHSVLNPTLSIRVIKNEGKKKYRVQFASAIIKEFSSYKEAEKFANELIKEG